VADRLGTTRYAIRNRCDNDSDLGQALADARERQIDKLEAVVYERAEESNDTTLQIFLLKTQGRHRGYDQSEAQHAAKDIATAAFDFILNKANESTKPSTL
jgi:predicted amidophosphoribosyltransferase